jgi:zinc protease
MRKIVLLFFAGCALALAQAGGARQESMKGIVLKNIAPVSNDVLRIQLPRGADRKLKNGLPVLVLENHRVPSVSLALSLPASTLDDPSGLPGVAEAVADMLKQGTATRGARQIAEAVAELGATLNIGAQYGGRTTDIGASTLTDNLDPLLDIVADVLLHPTFPQDELDKWKARKLGALQQARANPNFLASERLHMALYSGDARAVNAATADSIKRITRDDLVAFYKAHYRPGNALLGVTGDIAPDAITSKLDKVLAAWESGTAPEPKLELHDPVAGKKVYLVNRPNSVQTMLMLTNLAIGRTSPDYVACMVMNRVLGDGPSARLFRNIREDKGYTYGAYSRLEAGKYLNHFAASASVRTEVTAPAIDEFVKEFRAIRETSVPRDELENAKRAIVANFALSLENQSSVLRQVMTQRQYRLPADYWDTYPEKVMAVTAADVQRVARKYIPVDNLQLIAVGDASKIAEALKKYGPVEQYDAEGKRAGGE